MGVGKFSSFGFAKGRLVLGKTKCAKCAVANSIFCAVGCFNFFLVSAFESPSWSAGLCRDTAKLSAELRSSEESGQDVKGRWFGCHVYDCSVVF